MEILLQIEITCRGQQLLPFLTLQHVRDNIWSPRDTTTRPLLSDSSTTTDHVMVLHYGRTTNWKWGPPSNFKCIVLIVSLIVNLWSKPFFPLSFSNFSILMGFDYYLFWFFFPFYISFNWHGDYGESHPPKTVFIKLGFWGWVALPKIVFPCWAGGWGIAINCITKHKTQSNLIH